MAHSELKKSRKHILTNANTTTQEPENLYNA